jgi:hypothetical protein
MWIVARFPCRTVIWAGLCLMVYSLTQRKPYKQYWKLLAYMHVSGNQSVQVPNMIAFIEEHTFKTIPIYQ